ncbi:MAG: dehydrogenase [Candidatus Brocadiia bacterium]
MPNRIIRAKAPLRLGFAGGGTDVSPYSDLYGGQILNATISMYAYAVIEPHQDKQIIIDSVDRGKFLTFKAARYLRPDGNLDLIKGVYNRVVKDYNNGRPLSFKITTYVDAPPGSGLGSSSTLTVAILGAFVEWLNLPLGEYDIAHLAYEIERRDLKLPGGKQDQYAATFGGFNFIEFYQGDKVIVNPLRIKSQSIAELEFNTLLYYTGASRTSSSVVESQVKNVTHKKKAPLEAMHHLKTQAVMLKEALLRNELNKIGEILDYGWHHKKKTAGNITNSRIEEIYETAKKAGAAGGKVSGAGGGGFMMLYCPRNTRYKVIQALQKLGGEFRRFQFTKHGLTAWTSK